MAACNFLDDQARDRPYYSLLSVSALRTCTLGTSVLKLSLSVNGNVAITGHFGGSGRVIGPVCVCGQ